MDNTQLTHWGVKGMKWGIRRYQKKDGSLTLAGKRRQAQINKQRVQNLEKARQARAEKKQQEADEKELKKKLLKSTDADELYKNRHLLTTAELNERMNRIDTERRLSQIAASTKKTGMDYVNKALDVGRKVDEAYKFVSGSAIGKEIAKQLGMSIKTKSKVTDYLSKSVSSLSDDDLKDAVVRMQREKTYNNLLKELNEAKNPKRTATKNLIGDISDLTDQQVKDILNRLTDEDKVIEKLSSRK